MAHYNLQDANEVIPCPYNKFEMITIRRMPQHLIRCPHRKASEREFETCPYNAIHIVPRSDYRQHLNTCPATVVAEKAINYELEKQTENVRGVKLKGCTEVPEYDQYKIQCSENWDDDEEDDDVKHSMYPFVPSMISDNTSEKSEMDSGIDVQDLSEVEFYDQEDRRSTRTHQGRDRHQNTPVRKPKQAPSVFQYSLRMAGVKQSHSLSEQPDLGMAGLTHSQCILEQPDFRMGGVKQSHSLPGQQPEHRIGGLKQSHSLSGQQPEHRMGGLKQSHSLPGQQPEHRMGGLKQSHSLPEQQPEHRMGGFKQSHSLPGQQPEHRMGGLKQSHSLPEQQPEHRMGGFKQSHSLHEQTESRVHHNDSRISESQTRKEFENRIVDSKPLDVRPKVRQNKNHLGPDVRPKVKQVHQKRGTSNHRNIQTNFRPSSTTYQNFENDSPPNTRSSKLRQNQPRNVDLDFDCSAQDFHKKDISSEKRFANDSNISDVKPIMPSSQLSQGVGRGAILQYLLSNRTQSVSSRGLSSRGHDPKPKAPSLLSSVSSPQGIGRGALAHYISRKMSSESGSGSSPASPFLDTDHTLHLSPHGHGRGMLAKVLDNKTVPANSGRKVLQAPERLVQVLEKKKWPTNSEKKGLLAVDSPEELDHVLDCKGVPVNSVKKVLAADDSPEELSLGMLTQVLKDNKKVPATLESQFKLEGNTSGDLGLGMLIPNLEDTQKVPVNQEPKVRVLEDAEDDKEFEEEDFSPKFVGVGRGARLKNGNQDPRLMSPQPLGSLQGSNKNFEYAKNEQTFFMED